MNKQQELEAKIRELLPELQELSFGCRIECEGRRGQILNEATTKSCKEWYYLLFEDKGSPTLLYPLKAIEIIGHDITLEHVLRCLPNFAYSEVKGFIEFHTQLQHYTRKAVYWQLGKPLSDQSQEVIEFLYPIICTV